MEAREPKRLFHLGNKKTVADQIQKCAPEYLKVVRIALAADHGDAEGDGFLVEGIGVHRTAKPACVSTGVSSRISTKPNSISARKSLSLMGVSFNRLA